MFGKWCSLPELLRATQGIPGAGREGSCALLCRKEGERRGQGEK